MIYFSPEENQEEKDYEQCEISEDNNEYAMETEWNESEEDAMVCEEVLKSYDGHSLDKPDK